MDVNGPTIDINIPAPRAVEYRCSRENTLVGRSISTRSRRNSVGPRWIHQKKKGKSLSHNAVACRSI